MTTHIATCHTHADGSLFRVSRSPSLKALTNGGQFTNKKNASCLFIFARQLVFLQESLRAFLVFIFVK